MGGAVAVRVQGAPQGLIAILPVLPQGGGNKQHRTSFMNDNDQKAETLRLQLLRQMPPGKRLALAAGWSTSLRHLSRAALRQQHAGASGLELQRLFAERWLGPELAAALYPTAEVHG